MIHQSVATMVVLKIVLRARKKVLSASLGQVDFLAGLVTFKTYLPNGQGSRIVIL